MVDSSIRDHKLNRRKDMFAIHLQEERARRNKLASSSGVGRIHFQQSTTASCEIPFQVSDSIVSDFVESVKEDSIGLSNPFDGNQVQGDLKLFDLSDKSNLIPVDVPVSNAHVILENVVNYNSSNNVVVDVVSQIHGGNNYESSNMCDGSLCQLLFQPHLLAPDNILISEDGPILIDDVLISEADYLTNIICVDSHCRLMPFDRGRRRLFFPSCRPSTDTCTAFVF